MRGQVAAAWRGMLERGHLLWQVRRAGRWQATLYLGLQTTRAVMPALRAISVGYLVGALTDPAPGRAVGPAAVAVAAVFGVDQIAWLGLLTVRSLLVRRIDGDVRLFALGDWFAGRARGVGMRTFGPVWRAMTSMWRQQWWTVLLVVTGAVAAMAVPAAAVLSGDLATDRLITYVLAGWGVLAVSAMGSETFDIEYGLRGVRAVDQLTGAHRRTAAGQGAVTVLVSHRFTTARMADLVILLQDGRISETGSHAELMAAGGDYAELYRLQERAYR